LLAHEEFLDLARDRHRERVHELYVAWDLVMGDLPLTVFLQLLFCDLFTRLDLDPEPFGAQVYLGL